jgi:hypothetical protein
MNVNRVRQARFRWAKTAAVLVVSLALASLLAGCGTESTPQILVVTATFTVQPVVQVVTATFTPGSESASGGGQPSEPTATLLPPLPSATPPASGANRYASAATDRHASSAADGHIGSADGDDRAQADGQAGVFGFLLCGLHLVQRP